MRVRRLFGALGWAVAIVGLFYFRADEWPTYVVAFFFIFSTVPIALHNDRLLPERLSRPDIRRAMLAAGLTGVLVLPLAFIQVRPALALPGNHVSRSVRNETPGGNAPLVTSHE